MYFIIFTYLLHVIISVLNQYIKRSLTSLLNLIHCNVLNDIDILSKTVDNS